MSTKTVATLRAEAKKKGIVGYSKMRKAELIAALGSPKSEAKSMKLIVGREKRYASGEKFVWRVSSVDDVSAKLEVLVDRKWLVPAILNPGYGMAKKLWTKRGSLSGRELADWGFDEITVAFGKSVGAEGYSAPEFEGEEEGYSLPRFGGKLKK